MVTVPGYTVEFGLRAEDRQVHAAVVIDEEDILAVVAALRDVNRHRRNRDSGCSGHNRSF